MTILQSGHRNRPMIGHSVWVCGIAVVGLLMGVFAAPPAAVPERSTAPVAPALRGIHKIRHVIIIMQENRSFDSYFGTFPGANGIPMRNGVPRVCVPDPARGGCVRPFLDNTDRDTGGPHGPGAAVADVHGGRMNGFLAQAELYHTPAAARDVMGYRNRRSIPNYWTYAKRFALQDRMFASASSWSLPEHLFMVSEWAANCRSARRPMSCVGAISGQHGGRDRYAWTDLTYLLHRHHVSWRYYVKTGVEPDCEDAAERICVQAQQSAQKEGIWNPLPAFTTVRQNHQVRNVQALPRFFGAAKSGRLPSVTWIVPGAGLSEHPPSSVASGQAYVTRIINTVMRSPQWRSTAIFLSWDEWGGLYDHVRPPRDDRYGYGLRVPGLVISPYARRGFIDHQTLSHDAYVKFIEDDFLNGARLDPRTDGRPDRRPNVREKDQRLGNLARDFNFNQRPRRPLILPLRP